MELLALTLTALVAVLAITLFAVHKIRPRALRVSVNLTRWLSLSLEVESPEGDDSVRQKASEEPPSRGV